MKDKIILTNHEELNEAHELTGLLRDLRFGLNQAWHRYLRLEKFLCKAYNNKLIVKSQKPFENLRKVKND